MNKKQFGLGLLLLLGLAHTGFASAATLSLSPVNINAVESGPVNVDVIISGLMGAEVGAFEITIGYDSSLLTATDVAFSGNLGLPGIQTIPGFDLTTLGSVYADELSLLPIFPSPPNPTLGDLQDGSSVQLATLSFMANSVGTASLGFNSWLISDAFGDVISIDDTFGAMVEISPIPLPGALWLMISGLLGIGIMARKRGQGG